MLLTGNFARIIGFDSQLIFDSIITAINILVLFAGLSFLVFNPVRKLLTDRQNKIKKEIQEAQEKLTQANQIKAEYEKKLSDVKIEIESLLENARNNAKEQQNEIIENARKEAFAIVERGNREITLEKEKAMDELKNEVINISTLLATKIVKETINKERFDKLFNETLEVIGQKTWQD